MFQEELTYGKKYAAIEHAEKATFNLLQLAKKKQEFVIAKKKNGTNFKEIITALKGQKHAFLIVNNDQVLFKKIAANNSEPTFIVRAAFPNITISDFYYEIFGNDTNSFVAIARKEYVDNLILEYATAGISIVDFSLGNLAVKNLQDFIDQNSLYSSNAKISLTTGVVSAIEKEPKTKSTYKINDLEISNQDVLPLGGIISYYSKNPSSTIYKELKEKYIQKRFFDVGIKASLGFLLLLLLVNFLFFTSYRDHVGKLTGELELSKTYKNQLNNLQKEVAEKNRLVKSVYSASNSKLSQYIDELGSSVPKNILLSQIEYQPIAGVVKTEKEIAFKKNTFIVKGAEKKNDTFSSWVSMLEKKDWIQNIEIKEYGKGKKRGSLANFEFIITLYD